MNIIRLTPAHAEEYWSLRLEALTTNPHAFLMTYDEAIQRTNPINQTKERLQNKNNYTYGAFAENELIGVVTLLRETHPKMMHRATIFAMYVTQKKRGLGVGAALLASVIQEANCIPGLKKINLSVTSGNSEAKRLYQKLGFSVYGLDPKAQLVDNHYFDEELMTLLL
ncbi:GNAT family N-acetyltransferase [Bacillus sp. 2205SS5-2]|uniref:GNAT family N-acetyltransferase n=1 Tax=Bacillus sp. 2205SS5-2 TaxID=3109031 RepID=UPI003005700D